ncbi:Wzz/FepE/Etk N-terminal domain-containing protein [Marivita sp. S6314]|uniref:Wzz/FepE/Etk N-terminal domain-containing protein n=1 Tax=Marivita sp. S6314 TaxID=2926406 RepID=UPI001FF429FE|nr:Wzz/FepE/Etk N-terminal domain-containing protein [Marivita sp. S6314]MCK0151698.1 Wzz/FepE/Etk N-terminal domain-containing protein [Marivita sp. S6314]
MLYFQSISEVLSALKRRKGLIVALTLLGCVISLVVALIKEPVYSAIAVVQIEDAQVTGTTSTIGAPPDTRSSLDASRTVRLIEQRVMSRGSLFEIMEEHGLFADNPSMTPNERITAMRQSILIEAIMSGEPWQPNQAVSGMVIYVNLNDAQKAADVANDVLDRVMEEARIRSVDRARFELDFFNTEEARIRAEISAAEDAVAEFKSANAEVLPSNITVLQGELTTLNGTLITLRQQILSLESNSGRTRADALERQVNVLEDQIALIESRIVEINGLLARAPGVERELISLERERAQLTEQFTVISRRKADAEMSQSLEEQRQLARFEVLERAEPPVYATSGSKRSVAMLGAVASVIMAAGIALALEMLNPPIRTASQMERALGVRPVISVPILDTPPPPKKGGKGNGSKFGLGVAVALLLGAIALVAKPLTEWASMHMAQRNAQ